MYIHQIIQGVHSPSAGPSYSVAKLSDELCRLGEESSVHTLGLPPTDWPYDTQLKVHDGFLERKTGVSIALMLEIRKLSARPCILHGHGIWRVANLFPLFIGRDHQARIVWSPRGTMSEWSMQYKRIIKQPFWHLLQKPALERCHCFHLTAPLEYDAVRRLGLRAPVAVIPNGIDIPKIKSGNAKAKRVVFLSRIDPVKGVDMLLAAWNRMARAFPDWELVIAGPINNAYADTMQSLAKKMGVTRVQFPGEVHGDAKHSLLTSASLFVLPSHSENFGVAVAEALAHGVPVITTTATPWGEVATRGCGWCITPTQDEFTDALDQALRRPLPKLHEMGRIGRSWMQDSYAWVHIAERMQQVYEWLLYGASQPDWIIED